MCRGRVITVGVVVVGAFAGGLRAAGDEPQSRVPLAVYPLPANTTFERYEAGGNAVAAVRTAERLIYSNTLGTWAAPVGANNLLADDIATTGTNGCKLRRYEFPVVGKVDPNGVGGPYSVDFALYSNCPGSVPPTSRPGLIISGIAGHVDFPDDGPRLISVVVPEGGNVTLRTNMWLGVTFSRDNAGVVVGAPALVGFSADQFDFPGSPCNNNFGGFPEQPQGSMNLEIYADADCAEAFVGYKDNKPSGSTYNPGPNVTFADDIRLGVNGCQMVAYEVAIKRPAFYDFDLRRDCEGPAIPGTERSVIISSGTDVKIARFTFDPPIPLPQNLWFSAKLSNATGGVVIAGQQACIGQTANYIGILGQNGCDQNDPFSPQIHAAFSLAITCAGLPPVGACCDMALLDANGEAVCREVPQMNCPWPWPQYTSTLQPQWVGGASCNPDPFPFPCGLAACCRPDDVCENLTLNQCNAIPPLSGPRQWQRGRYCDVDGQRCPWAACLARTGDCHASHEQGGCQDPQCCGAVCEVDPWCCQAEWDRLCVQLADQVCPYASGNDKCQAPYGRGAVLVEADSNTFFANTYATESGSDPGFCCRSNAPGATGFGTVWFKFTATDTSAEISTCNSDPAEDSLFQLFAVGDPSTEETACATLSMMACSDDVDDCGGGRHGKICARNLTPGQTYYVMVAAKTPETKGAYQLDIRSPCFDEPIWIAEDCNGNGLQDGCELGSGLAADCNGNHVLDECDIANGTSFDCDDNQFLDECTGVVDTLAPSPPTVYGGFGHSVDMDGPWLVVGTSDLYYLTPQGGDYVHIFRRTPTGWTAAAEFFLPDAPAYVAIDGGWIVASSEHSSVAYLFRFESGEWTPAGALSGPSIEPCPRWGFPVAVSGSLIALSKGFCQNQAALPEEVYVFRHDGSQWVEDARIGSPDGSGPNSFGASISLDGDRLLIGATGVQSNTLGAAYVFRRIDGKWQNEGKLSASNGQVGDFFGRSCALSDPVAVVGATIADSPNVPETGAVYVFRREGSTWSQAAQLTASDAAESARFGFSVRVFERTVVVGATTYSLDDDRRRAVYVFREQGKKWTEEAILLPPDQYLAAGFGHGVSTDGSFVAVGAPFANLDTVTDAGIVYVFQPPPPDCNGNGIPDLCDVRDATSADCNADGVPDECEVLRPFDYDFDGDVDLIDLAGFQRCFTGPGPATVAPCCRMFDGESDGDVDGVDFVAFNRAFAGP